MKLKDFLLAVLMCIFLASLIGCGSRQHISKKELTATKKRVINPWTWQHKYGFVQANEVTVSQRMLFCAGQISVDHRGNLLYPGNMEKQMMQIANNLETIFQQSEAQLSDIVRITYYTTDIAAFTKANVSFLVNRLEKWGCEPATSLIGVASLARPGCVVELEATAVVSCSK